MLLAIGHDSRRSMPLEQVMDAFGLTRAEARIAWRRQEETRS
jgi:hypothetical protein